MSESYPFTPRMVAPGEVVQIVRNFTKVGVKLVQLQHLAGFEVCEVRVDSHGPAGAMGPTGTSVVYKDNAWEGQLVEKGSALTTVFKNITEETQPLQGVWYADFLEVEPAVEAVASTTEAVVEAATETQETVLLKTETVASPKAAKVQVDNAASRQSSHTEDFPKESVFIEAEPNAPPPPQKKKVREGRDHTASVTPGYNEVAICLTFDQLRRIHEVLNQASSSFMHHNEIPGIMRPFIDAMESLQD